jgi:hypothetical protein
MDERTAQQLVAELIEVNEQAFVVLLNTVADITGRSAVADALEHRLATARAAGGHPMALAMLGRAMKSLKAH